MHTETLDTPLGAIIQGFDAAKRLSARDINALRRTFYERGVVCIRGQNLTPESLLALAKHFGEPDEHYLSHYQHPDHKTIMLVSNIQKDGRDIGHADAGRTWHSDGSYLQTPVAVSMLYALEVPVDLQGHALGATQFVSAATAYDKLPKAQKRRLEGLEVIHQVAGRRKSTGTGQGDMAQRRAQPDAIHPIVRKHSITGRPYLFVNQGECVEIRGLEKSEGTALIEKMADAIVQSEDRYVHQWEVGDLLIWDNQNVQHLATFDYQWPEHRRLMYRVTITEGTEPPLSTDTDPKNTEQHLNSYAHR